MAMVGESLGELHNVTIVLESTAHFHAPNGSNIQVHPGAYHVSVGPDGHLLLGATQKPGQHGTVLRAFRIWHSFRLTSPLVVSIGAEHDSLHIVLLLPAEERCSRRDRFDLRPGSPIRRHSSRLTTSPSRSSRDSPGRPRSTFIRSMQRRCWPCRVPARCGARSIPEVSRRRSCQAAFRQTGSVPRLRRVPRRLAHRVLGWECLSRGIRRPPTRSLCPRRW